MKFIVRMMLCLIISFTLVELPVMKAEASMISTNEAVELMKREQAEKNVALFLDRSDVKNQLIKIGVSPEDAQRKIAGLSDKEVRNLSTDIEQAKLGGDVGGILVVILLVILIIYFVKRI